MEQKKPEVMKTFIKLVEEVFSLASHSMSMTHRGWQADYEKEFLLKIEKVDKKDFSEYVSYLSEGCVHESITQFILPNSELLYEIFKTDNTGCNKSVLSFGGSQKWKKYTITEIVPPGSEEKRLYLNPEAVYGNSEEALLPIGQELYPFRKYLKNSHFFRHLMQQFEAGKVNAEDIHYFQFAPEFYEKWLYRSNNPVLLLENLWQYNLWQTEKTGKDCINTMQEKYSQTRANISRGSLRESDIIKAEVASWIDKKHLNEKLNLQLAQSPTFQKNKKI